MSRPRLRVIRVCGGVRGRGRWVTSPGAFILLFCRPCASFSSPFAAAVRLPARLFLSSHHSRSFSLSAHLPRLPAKVTGQQRDSVHSESATLPVLCIRCASASSTTLFLSLPPSSPLALVIGGSCMRAWWELNCRGMSFDVLILRSVVAVWGIRWLIGGCNQREAIPFECHRWMMRGKNYLSWSSSKNVYFVSNFLFDLCLQSCHSYEHLYLQFMKLMFDVGLNMLSLCVGFSIIL